MTLVLHKNNCVSIYRLVFDVSQLREKNCLSVLRSKFFSFNQLVVTVATSVMKVNFASVELGVTLLYAELCVTLLYADLALC